jgi:hypothetical protein
MSWSPTNKTWGVFIEEGLFMNQKNNGSGNGSGAGVPDNPAGTMCG